MFMRKYKHLLKVINSYLLWNLFTLTERGETVPEEGLVLFL